MQHADDLDYVPELITSLGKRTELSPSINRVDEDVLRKRFTGRFKREENLWSSTLSFTRAQGLLTMQLRNWKKNERTSKALVCAISSRVELVSTLIVVFNTCAVYVNLICMAQTSARAHGEKYNMQTEERGT